MRLIVVDPRHAGLASKADLWLRVRPGTDGALALGLANLMIAARLVRPRFHARLEQRTAASTRRQRATTDRA